MSNTPDFDVKVKAILDATTPWERTCALTGEKWMMDEEEIGWYRKLNVPPSKCSPLTRLRVITAYFIGVQWWNNKSAKDGSVLISATHPASGIKVLSDDDWFASDFSGITVNPDETSSAFAAIETLCRQIPITGNRNLVKPVNSIAAISNGDEDSYFVNASKTKRTLFGMNAMDVEDSAEIFQSLKVGHSYRLVHCERIFNCRYLQECRDCINSQFLFDCRNCEDCFMSVNKRNKKFVFRNEQLTETEYRARMSQIDFTRRSSVQVLQQEYDEMVRSIGIWPENFNEDAPESTGEYLTHVSNCHDCHWVANGCNNNFQAGYVFNQSSDNMNCAGWFSSNNSYYSSIGSRSANIKYSFTAIQCQNCEYCYHCYNCEDCFGCVGLNRKRFCIFNTQYTEEEYWKKLDEVKCAMLDRGEYGDYLPVPLSPVRFGDSGSVLFFLADRKIGDQIGALDYPPETAGACGEDRVAASSLQASELMPDCIDDPTLAEWVGKPVFDAKAQRRFVLLPQELKMFKELRIAPSDRHFVSRVQDLALRANGGAFMNASCEKCHQSLRVAENKTYPVRRIYCKEDYLKFLEGNA